MTTALSPISMKTAHALALAHREIEVAEKLLKDVTEAQARIGRTTDIRDAFGRTQHGLQLGVPSGENGHRLFNLPFSICGPVIEAHIAQQRVVVAALTQAAIDETRLDAVQSGEAA